MSDLWNTEDPRHSIGKWAAIVIVDRRSPHLAAGIGQVETKNGWSITTDFETYRHIGADAEWPEGFVWALAPEGGRA